MPLDIRLLGTFAVTVDGTPVDDARWSRRQAAVLVKLLALARHHRLHQEQVMETMWPGADPDTAGNGLHKMVHLARHALEPELRAGNDSRFLTRSEGQLALVAKDGIRVDADEFERLASQALKDRNPDTCQRALRLYDGDLLPADRFAEWARARREQLRALHLQVLEMLGDLQTQNGDASGAIATLQQLLAAEPTHEPAHRRLMTAFVRAGSRTQALRQYEHLRAELRRELGTEPDATTTALHAKIAAGVESAPPPAPAAPPPDDAAVAVLPFANLTGDPGREYLATGIAETLIRALSRVPTLRVMAPSTVLRYRGRETDPRQVGRELGVATALFGRLDQWGERMAISVELVRTRDGSLLWGERFERSAPDLVDVEHSIAGAVAARLSTSARAPGTATTRVPEAYEHYLRGRHEWNKRTGEALAAAARHFERAIDADPTYALAWSGLADAHALAGLYAPIAPQQSMPKARAAAERALQLDPELAEAHTSLAYVQFAFDWDFAAAERGFLRAIELAPSYATAHQWRHELLTALGRVPEQRAAIERAVALDPLSPILATEVGWGLWYARDFAAALRRGERVVAQAPQFPAAWLVLGLAQLCLHDADAACDTLGHAQQLAGQPFPFVLGALGLAQARAGRAAAAVSRLDELTRLARQTPTAQYAMALVQCGLGERAAALASLRAALVGRADRMVYLPVDPLFDELRGEREFDTLVARVRQPRP